MPGNDLIGTSLGRSNTMILAETTPEERRQAIKTVCGSEHCQGPDDAKVILEALGLLDPKKVG